MAAWKFNLTIKLGNDAMTEYSDISEAVLKVADKLSKGNENGLVFDKNGNTVGEFSITR